MHITLIGMSHKTAPVAVREHFAFSPEEVASALPRFGGAAVLLSTCNRTEVYLAVHHPITAGAIIALLHEMKGDPDAPDDAFYHYTDHDATRHLFGVAAGIDSMVLGESEILGQVRAAFAAAKAANTENAVLARLFNSAISVGRKARSQTRINHSSVSVSSTAVALARRTLGDLSSRTVLVVSAGEAGKLAARSLAEQGASRVLVANRTAGRAKQLAAELGGEAVQYANLGAAMAEADIVISSSAAPGYLIGPKETLPALAGRNGRPLLMIDIAVPRDIDPAVRELPNVHLYDIDDLQGMIEQNKSSRQGEVAKVQSIIDEELRRFNKWMRARGVVPTVAALRSRADAVREAELERTNKRLGDLTPKQRAGVEAMANALVKKLLHDPIERLKGEDGERYVGAIRELFSLDADAEEPASEA